MPLIPYPNVANYQGVPVIARLLAGTPQINIQVVPQQDWMINQSSDGPAWGIFNLNGTPFYEPAYGGTLSVLTFGFGRQMMVSTFPVEANKANQGAAFASYNKVYQPSNPLLTLALSGNEYEKTAFLQAIDAACTSTTLYNVSTPDAVYQAPQSGCTIESYSYQRSATRAATMLIVDVSLKQVLQVAASLTNVSITPSPQSPSATDQVNNGNTQTTDASMAILQRLLSSPPLIGVK